MTDGVGARFPAGGGASERASPRADSCQDPLAGAWLSEAPSPDARKHHELRPGRQDSWPAASPSSRCESALAPASAAR